MKSAKKSSRMSTGGGNSRRVSVGGNTVQTARPDSSQSARGTPSSRPSKKDDNTGAPQSTGKFLGHCRFLEAKSSVQCVFSDHATYLLCLQMPHLQGCNTWI